METNDCEVIQLELKYCERCGGLWLRRQGADHVYCAPCSLEMHPAPLRKRMVSKPRLPINRRPGVYAQLELIRGLRGEGGTA